MPADATIVSMRSDTPEAPAARRETAREQPERPPRAQSERPTETSAEPKKAPRSPRRRWVRRASFALLPIALTESQVDKLFNETYAFNGFKLTVDLERQVVLTGDAGFWEMTLKAAAGLQRFLDVPTAGLWRDSLESDDLSAPASSLYHIVGAIVQLDRVVEGAA